MKRLLCIILVITGSGFAEEDKKTEKRGVFGLGYGYRVGYAAPVPYIAHYAPAVGYSLAPALTYGHGLGYSAGHYAPAKVGYTAGPALAYGHGLGYAAAPGAIVVAPGYDTPAIGYDYAAPAYNPAYANIGLGYGFHH